MTRIRETMVDQEIGDHERAKIWIRLRVNGSEQGREDGTIKSGLTGSKAAPLLDPFYAYVPALLHVAGAGKYLVSDIC
jgi:hypothetical protein